MMNDGDSEHSMDTSNQFDRLYAALTKVRSLTDPVMARNLTPGLGLAYSLSWSRVYDELMRSFGPTSDAAQRASDGSTVIPAAVTNDPVWREVTSEGQRPPVASGWRRDGAWASGQGSASPAQAVGGTPAREHIELEQPARQSDTIFRREEEQDRARHRAASAERARRTAVKLSKVRRTYRRRR